MTLATAKATTQATTQATEEEEDTTATPRAGNAKEAEGQDRKVPNAPEDAATLHPTEPDTPLGTIIPRRQGTKPHALREGNPADAGPTHRAERPNQTTATQIKRATPHLTAPPVHQPAT